MLIKHITNLRLELGGSNPVYEGEDVLVISSGISCDRSLAIDWINAYLALDQNVEVVLVLGASDYWNSDIQTTDKWYKNTWVRRLYVLNNSSVIIDGVAFWGSTYWDKQEPLVEPFDLYTVRKHARTSLRMFLKLNSLMPRVVITCGVDQVGPDYDSEIQPGVVHWLYNEVVKFITI